MKATVRYLDPLDHPDYQFRVEAAIRRWWRPWRTEELVLFMSMDDRCRFWHRNGKCVESYALHYALTMAVLRFKAADDAHRRALEFERLELRALPEQTR